MGGIAKRAGLSRTLVNFYFGDKHNLHSQLEVLALDKLIQMMTRAQSSQTLGIDKLISMVRSYVRFSKKHPGYFAALTRNDEPGIDHTLKQPSKDAMANIVLVIEVGIKDGSISHGFTSHIQAALIFWASAHGCILIAHNKAEMLKGHWGTSASALLKNLEILVLSSFANAAGKLAPTI